MSYIFYNLSIGNTATRHTQGSGIDQEVIHRICLQARFERAKVVRQCFAILTRAILKRMTATNYIGRSAS